MCIHFHIHQTCILKETEQVALYIFIITLGAEIAGYIETHDATQIEGGCGKEPGTKAGDHY